MKITNTIDIRSTPEKVFYWLEDPDRAKRWMTSVTKTEIVKETSTMVGTTFREYIEENGRGTEMYGVVTEFVSNKKLAFHLEGQFNTVDVEFVLDEKDGITTLTQNAKITFKGVLKVLSIFLSYFIKNKLVNQAQGEFDKLKELCERNVKYEDVSR